MGEEPDALHNVFPMTVGIKFRLIGIAAPAIAIIFAVLWLYPTFCYPMFLTS
jgi:hypothetical protein